MSDHEKINYNMSDEEKKLSIEYDELNKKIKNLDILLKKYKNRLKSTRLKPNEESSINTEIYETERMITNHIKTRNIISKKLYGSEVKEDVKTV